METRKFSYKDTESNEDMSGTLFLAKRRYCFCIPCFGSSNQSTRSNESNWWQRIRTSSETQHGSLWARGVHAVKKLREWSEIVAGPKWKTFIRRFNRNKSGTGVRQGSFQYDPLSYALNFDEGPGHNGNSVDDERVEEDYVYRNFSARYASVPMSAKKTMDVGKEAHGYV